MKVLHEEPEIHLSNHNINLPQRLKFDSDSDVTKRTEHLRTHTIYHENTEGTPLFKCTQWKYATKRKVNLKSDVLVHTNMNIPLFSCKECSYVTKLKTNSKRHALLREKNEQK